MIRAEYVPSITSCQMLCLKMHDHIASLQCLHSSKVLSLFSIYRRGSEVLRITCQWSHRLEGSTEQWLAPGARALFHCAGLLYHTPESRWAGQRCPEREGRNDEEKLLPKTQKTQIPEKQVSWRENSISISTSLKSPHWGPWLALAMPRIALLQNGHEPGRWTFLVLSLLGGKITTCKSKTSHLEE